MTITLFRKRALTKQFKKETASTHNYSMPKPTNEVVLTNTLTKDIPEEITTPNIENNIEDELTKLGISSTLLTFTDSRTDQKGAKISTLPSIISHAASPSSRPIEHEVTSVQGPGRATLKQQCHDTQTNQEGSKKKTSIHQSSVSHATSSPLRRTWELEETREETSQTAAKQDYDEPEYEAQLGPQSIAQGHKADQSGQQCQAETIKQIYAKQPEERTLDESNTKDQPPSLNSMKPTKRTSHTPAVQPLKLSQQEYLQAYPWAHKASENTFNKTELSKEVEYVNIPQHSIGKYLTSEMRDQLKENINLPDVVIEKINNCIGMTERNDKPTYFCKVCNITSPYNNPKRVMCARHVRIHLGYSLYRYFVCNFISNTLTNVYSHYIANHGIPKNWISSQKKLSS